VSKRKSLLFLTTDLPYPANSGGRIKTYRFLEFLAKDYDVRLICVRGGKRKDDVLALKSSLSLESIQAFSIFKKRGVFNWLIALLNFPTFNAFRVYSLELETMIKWAMGSSNVVVVDHLEMIDLVPQKHQNNVIYHSHNAEFKIWHDYGHLNSSIFTSWAMNLEAGRVKRLERYAINSTSFTFAAPNDQETLSTELGIGSEKFRLTYHLGNDELLQLPDLQDKQQKRIFYAGTLDWEPNRDGLTWFLKECWPTVKSEQPDMTFQICGKGANPELLTLMKRSDGVEYLGFVPDLTEVMDSCTLAIVPLRFGSGMKIKTLDAMYRGLPVVTTKVGAEGIELVSQKHAVIADDANEFATAITRLTSDKELWSMLSVESRALARSKYTYSALAESMLNDINLLIK
jgi:glycosyltransferase involved in cell wall biosynthesis